MVVTQMGGTLISLLIIPCPWCGSILSLFPIIAPHLRFIVGKKDFIRFWKDNWWNDQCLSSTFRKLFRLACMKDAMVSEVISYSTSDLSWSLPFSRDLYNWEVDWVVDLVLCLNEVFLFPFLMTIGYGPWSLPRNFLPNQCSSPCPLQLV